MTVEKYSRDQLRGAFAWLADWESGEQCYGDEDQSESARRVLGPRAFDVVRNGAQQFQRRWSGR